MSSKVSSEPSRIRINFLDYNQLRITMSELDKILSTDTDGMASYEYLVNHIDADCDFIDKVADNIIRVDNSGQFVSSAARYLNAIEPERCARTISRLINAAIEKDRDHVYLPDLLSAIWGKDYMEHAEELRESDDNFRRIYKRIYPSGLI